MKICKAVCLLLISAVLCGCQSADVRSEEIQISGTVDIRFLTQEETQDITEETQEDTYLLESQYVMDTKITDKDGNELISLINGEHQFRKDGLLMAGFVNEIAENSIIGPSITYSTTIDIEKTEACLDIMEQAFDGFGLEGCVIVSDMDGKINVIANYTKTKAYFLDGVFLISEDDEHFEETETSVIVHEGTADESGNWSDIGEVYSKRELTVCNTYENYHSKNSYIGSTSKIFSSVVMLENKDLFPALTNHDNVYYDKEIQDFVYYDRGNITQFTPDDGGKSFSFNPSVYNSDTSRQNPSYSYPIRTQLINTSGAMTNAFVNSVNTFYANAYLQLGMRDIIRTFNQYFGLNKFGNQTKGYTVLCDWAEILQPDLSKIQEIADYPEWAKARLAFGMSSGTYEGGRGADDIMNFFGIAPVYLNAVSGLMATGNLYQLSVREDTSVLTAYDLPDENNDYASQEILPLENDIHEIMWNLMHSTAVHYHLEDTEEYQYFIKTGTADDASFKRLLVTGFVTGNECTDKEIDGKVITIFAYDGFGISEASGRGGGGFASLLIPVYQKIAQTVMD